MIANVKWVVSISLCLLGYWLIYKKLWVEIFKFIVFLFALFFAILPAWFYGGGDNTVTILYLIMMLIESFLMFDKGVFKWIFTLATAISCVALLTISYRFPNLIQRTGEQDVFVDILIQIFIIFAILTVSIAIYTKHYRWQHEQLTEVNKKLENLASIDMLSGLYNRRKFFEILDLFLEGKAFKNLYIIMIDVDKFKIINDTYGHQAGDAAIRHIAKHIQSVIDRLGTIGRYGGDEFIVLLTDLADVEVEKLANELSCVPMLERIPLHISGGIAKLKDETASEPLIAKADDLLILAKNKGRDQICLWYEG